MKHRLSVIDAAAFGYGLGFGLIVLAIKALVDWVFA